jgi:acetyl esterase/lipase
MDLSKIQKDITYKIVDDIDLTLDVYYPHNFQQGDRLPAVILIHGDDQGPLFAHIKEQKQYTSWGQLIAASGLIAITANHRRTDRLRNVVACANDINDLISYVLDHSDELAINPDKLCIWMCSMGTPFAMRAALNEAPPYVQAIVCYYGITELKAYYEAIYSKTGVEIDTLPIFTIEDFDEFSATDLLLRRPAEIAPIFIARAGLDSLELNDALDTFIAQAIEQNVEVTVMNHPTGQHAFDILNDSERSCEIIQATLTFMRTHLLQ